MKKRKPIHPGEILREMYLEPLQISQSEFAEKIEMSRKTVNSLCNEKGSITPNIALRLAKVFKTTPNLWLNMQNTYDLWEEKQKQKHLSITPIVSRSITAKGR
jgi:antitoxin HigA-1